MAAILDQTASTTWARQAARFLGRPERRLGSAAWPLLLTRGFPFGLLEPPPGSVETYRRTWWRAAAPEAGCTIEASLLWVSTEGGSTEVAVRSVARDGAEEVAGNLVVLRTGDIDARPVGERDVPKPPDVGDLAPGRSFVVDPDEIDRLEELLGRRSPVTDSDTFAHHQGFPAALTPGLVLLHRAFPGRHDWGPVGSVELWLPRPIPRGAVTEVRRSTTDPDLAVLRVIGRAAPAAIGRRSDEALR